MKTKKAEERKRTKDERKLEWFLLAHWWLWRFPLCTNSIVHLVTADVPSSPTTAFESSFKTHYMTPPHCYCYYQSKLQNQANLIVAT